MGLFKRRSHVEIIEPVEEHWMCLGGNGNLSVVLAFAFLLGTFIAFHIAHRYTQKNDAKLLAERRLLKKSRHRGGLMEWIERNFVAPFVPTKLETLILVVFFAWFTFTIFMGITRYYRRIWAVEMIGQQSMFNYFGYLFFGWYEDLHRLLSPSRMLVSCSLTFLCLNTVQS